MDDPLNLLPLFTKKDIKDARTLAEEDANFKIIDKDRDEKPLTIPVLNKTVMIGDIILAHYKFLNLLQ